jgi:hypothetical protein
VRGECPGSFACAATSSTECEPPRGSLRGCRDAEDEANPVFFWEGDGTCTCCSELVVLVETRALAPPPLPLPPPPGWSRAAEPAREWRDPGVGVAWRSSSASGVGGEEISLWLVGDVEIPPRQLREK